LAAPVATACVIVGGVPAYTVVTRSPSAVKKPWWSAMKLTHSPLDFVPET
jgi:hypothetical protein